MTAVRGRTTCMTRLAWLFIPPSTFKGLVLVRNILLFLDPSTATLVFFLFTFTRVVLPLV